MNVQITNLGAEPIPITTLCSDRETECIGLGAGDAYAVALPTCMTILVGSREAKDENRMFDVIVSNDDIEGSGSLRVNMPDEEAFELEPGITAQLAALGYVELTPVVAAE